MHGLCLYNVMSFLKNHILDCILGDGGCKANTENSKDLFQKSNANGDWMVRLQLCGWTKHEDIWVRCVSLCLLISLLSLFCSTCFYTFCCFFLFIAISTRLTVPLLIRCLYLLRGSLHLFLASWLGSLVGGSWLWWS